MNKLSESKYLEFIFNQAKESWDSTILLRLDLSRSTAHFFNPRANLKNRKLYKSYLFYQIIERWGREYDKEGIKENVLLNVHCDECSAIVDYCLGEQLEHFNDSYRNCDFFCRPIGDGITWYFKKEFFPDFYCKDLTPDMENSIYEGKSHYPIKEMIQMTMRLDRNGSAYMFDFSKTHFESFIKFLIEVKDYFYNHPQPI